MHHGATRDPRPATRDPRPATWPQMHVPMVVGGQATPGPLGPRLRSHAKTQHASCCCASCLADAQPSKTARILLGCLGVGVEAGLLIRFVWPCAGLVRDGAGQVSLFQAAVLLLFNTQDEIR
jgi:hypothetical protein